MRKLKFMRNKDFTKSMPSLVESSVSHFVESNEGFTLGNGFDHRNYESSENLSSTGLIDEELSSSMEGTLWLSVLLPSGKSVNMEIDANTAMMDLLVVVTTKNGVSPGGLVLKVPSDRPPGYISYKPNTPVGKLGCDKIEVVPKADMFERPRKQREKTANQPFEQTIRIQVDLPRGQKTFSRVNPRLSLGQVFRKICEENGGLDPAEYRIRAWGAPGLPLDLAQPLGDIGTIQFLIIAPKEDYRKSTGDIFGLYTKMPVEEKQKVKAKGFLGLFGKKKKEPASSWKSNPAYSENGPRLDGYEPPVQPYPSYTGAQVSNGSAKINLGERLVNSVDYAESSVPMREKTTPSDPAKRPKSMTASRHLSSGSNGFSMENGSPNEQTTNKAPGHRKKRQAPPPPKANLSTDIVLPRKDSPKKPTEQEEILPTEKPPPLQTTVVHSRQSSDSSGYHENSVISHSPGSKPPPLGSKFDGGPTERNPRSCASSDVSSDPGKSGSDDRTTSPSDWQDSLERRRGVSTERRPEYDASKAKKHKAPPPPVLPISDDLSEDPRERVPLTTVIGKDGKGADGRLSPLHISKFTDTQSPVEPEDVDRSHNQSTEAVVADDDINEIDGDFQEIIEAAEKFHLDLEEEEGGVPRKEEVLGQTEVSSVVDPSPKEVKEVGGVYGGLDSATTSSDKDPPLTSPSEKNRNNDTEEERRDSVLTSAVVNSGNQETARKIVTGKATNIDDWERENSKQEISESEPELEFEEPEVSNVRRESFTAVATVNLASSTPPKQIVKEEPTTPVVPELDLRPQTPEEMRKFAKRESKNGPAQSWLHEQISTEETWTRSGERSDLKSHPYGYHVENDANNLAETERKQSTEHSWNGSESGSAHSTPRKSSENGDGDSTRVTPRKNFAFKDTKKDLYPSMVVKSYEEEYYQQKRSVGGDYLDTIKYGVNVDSESDAIPKKVSMEQRDKDIDKQLSELIKKDAKQSKIVDEPRIAPKYKSTPESGRSEFTMKIAVHQMTNGGGRIQKEPSIPVHSDPVEELMEQKIITSRTNRALQESHNVTARFSRSLAENELNDQLQREYERLQEMFARWQKQMADNQATVASGKTVPDVQMKEFQVLQGAMVEQHQLVQRLCVALEQPMPESSIATEPTLVTNGNGGFVSQHSPGSSSNSAISSLSSTSSRTPSPPKTGFASLDRSRLKPVQKKPAESVPKNAEPEFLKRTTFVQRLSRHPSGGIDETDQANLQHKPPALKMVSNSLKSGDFKLGDSKQSNGGSVDTSAIVRPSMLRAVRETDGRNTERTRDPVVRASWARTSTDDSNETIVKPSQLFNKRSSTYKPPINFDSNSVHLAAPKPQWQTAFENRKAANPPIIVNSVKFNAVQEPNKPLQKTVNSEPPSKIATKKFETRKISNPPPAPPLPPETLPAPPPILAEMAKVQLKPSGQRTLKAPPKGGDPRNELLNSIRNFGGSGGLKKTK